MIQAAADGPSDFPGVHIEWEKFEQRSCDMKRGILTGLAAGALSALMVFALANCDDSGGSSCSAWCKKYGNCLVEMYQEYYDDDDDDIEWTTEDQRDCTEECKEWGEELEDDEEEEAYDCILDCRTESDCEDFFECYDDCYDYDDYYYYD
jgi:hypothetical protein